MSSHVKPKQETTLAWFKLAELIARKEREKALNVYRLLSHSFEDKAYALQIEGDILRSFNTSDAATKYQQAAYLYTQEKRWVHAVGIYEHLLLKDPNNLEIVITLVDLYAKLEWEDKCVERIETLMQLLKIQDTKLEQTYKTIKQVIQHHRTKNWFDASVNAHCHHVATELQSLIF